ncbi:MAG: glycerophosphodiester phosphodiesterase [Deltaproteobacteria bacterium]|nr:glycerophosphodiester phosphodiesterase [Deltaproteobacteria bacterium]
MQAALAAGAERLELDVHLTADGHLAVIHDAEISCRTDRSGPPEAHTLAALRALDLGYGYTADGGATHPLRGTGTGLLPTLPEVLEALPGVALLVDIKAGGPEVGAAVAEALSVRSSEDRARQIVYGSPAAVEEVARRLPEVRTLTRASSRACLERWLLTGWTGHVPAACRHTLVPVPLGLHRWVWGFSRSMPRRLARHGSEVVLIGPLAGGHSTGVDSAEDLARVPARYEGWIWTNRIEVIGPAVTGAGKSGSSP